MLIVTVIFLHIFYELKGSLKFEHYFNINIVLKQLLFLYNSLNINFTSIIIVNESLDNSCIIIIIHSEALFCLADVAR